VFDGRTLVLSRRCRMALNQANQPIRWYKRIGIWVWNSWFGFLVREVVSALFNIQRDDEAHTKRKKATELVFRRIAYFFLDYGLAVLSGALVIFLKLEEWSFFGAFVAMWVFDFIAAGGFLIYYLKTGEDLSLGQDFRRAVDAAALRSKSAAAITTFLVMFEAIAWTGPEKIITFFRKEIGTIPRMIATLTALTSLQAIVWTPIYWYGHSLYEMIRSSL
jgi:hypothetical protein